jgi:hypothetical protein
MKMGPALAACVGLVAAFFGPAAGCRRAGTDPPAPIIYDDPIWFRDETMSVGLDFHHQPGEVGAFFMPEMVGSGAGLLLGLDGRIDIYLVQNGGPNSSARNQLFHQRPDGRFENISAGSGLDIAGRGMGVAVGDFDNDGRPDVYVSQYGGGRLFRNKSDGTFEDVTQSAGAVTSGWGTSCCFVDYDRDGWLDLVIVNYVDYDPARVCGGASGKPDYCGPSTFQGTAMRLFHNRGRDSSGRWLGYEDVTHAAGVDQRGPGLGVLCADFDGDGWPDILVANDQQANRLWINQHNGTFKDEAVLRGVAFNGVGQAESNMGVTVGDVTSSGRLDLFITHLSEETNTFWQQISPGLFQDRTVASGLATRHWRGTGFAALLADFDLDGALDLAITNGRVARSGGEVPAAAGLPPYWLPYADRNQLYVNDGKGRFRDISRGNEAFCGSFAIGRGLVWGDFDGDGLLDLLVTNCAGPARFYRNVAARRGHWLLVRAIDPALHRDAYGAVITLQAGSRRWIGLINPGQGYLCSGDPRAHFGLGPVEHIDELRIDWPDGLAEIFPAPAVDVALRLERGKGRKAAEGNVR